MTSAEKRIRRNICTVFGWTWVQVRKHVHVSLDLCVLFHEQQLRNCGLPVFLRVGLEDVGETGAI